MLIVRLRPIGRKNKKLYRIVVSEKTKHVTKGQKEILGWYDPATKETELKVDRIKYYVEDLELDVSDRVKSILKKNSII